MLKRLKIEAKKWLYKSRSYLIATLGKGLLGLLMRTCRIEIEGLEEFCHLAATEKCLLMLWHNRLAAVPFILHRFTPQFIYAAVVSASRDGDMLRTFIHSYKKGRSIPVRHNARHQALRHLIQEVQEQKSVVIITPDGPRGPRYELKPGIAVAALETGAFVVALNWEASKCWKLRTWDGLRLPKPFSTIRVTFSSPIRFVGPDETSLEEAKAILKNALPSN